MIKKIQLKKKLLVFLLNQEAELKSSTAHRKTANATKCETRGSSEKGKEKEHAMVG